MELQLTLCIQANIAIGLCYNRYLKFAQGGCDFLVRLFRLTGCSLPPPSVLEDLNQHYYYYYYYYGGPGSVVGIATAYGLDGPGIESRWGEIFRTSPDRP